MAQQKRKPKLKKARAAKKKAHISRPLKKHARPAAKARPQKKIQANIQIAIGTIQTALADPGSILCVQIHCWYSTRLQNASIIVHLVHGPSGPSLRSPSTDWDGFLGPAPVRKPCSGWPWFVPARSLPTHGTRRASGGTRSAFIRVRAAKTIKLFRTSLAG